MNIALEVPMIDDLGKPNTVSIENEEGIVETVYKDTPIKSLYIPYGGEPLFGVVRVLCLGLNGSLIEVTIDFTPGKLVTSGKLIDGLCTTNSVERTITITRRDIVQVYYPDMIEGWFRMACVGVGVVKCRNKLPIENPIVREEYDRSGNLVTMYYLGRITVDDYDEERGELIKKSLLIRWNSFGVPSERCTAYRSPSGYMPYFFEYLGDHKTALKRKEKRQVKNQRPRKY